MHELLVPVGNMKCLHQAVMNGADAVYLGYKKYGARKYADNFTKEEIKEAIDYCHLYDVKLYATMNTLVKDDEVDEFLEQVLFLHKNGVDAIIMQDFGMISLVREMYPNLEIHASTQANISSSNIVRIFYEMGVKRVVFSRELSLDEIEKIDIPIEKEVFIHGALCISYSGNCLMSSMIGNRSGNRGECAGCCRLPYSLKHKERIISKNKYLLSTKELNTSYNLKQLINSSIYSFKIEGRMKSPEYVGFITKFYRQLIDDYETVDLDFENNKLKTIYNRKFTPGYLFNTNSSDLMNINSPNHIGLEIGKVIEITQQKIKIKLNKRLNQHDGIRFIESGKGFIINYLYNEKGKLVSSCDSICYVDNKINLKSMDRVSKTLDYNLNNKLKKLPVKKIKVKIEVISKALEKLKIKITDGKNEITEVGNVVPYATNSPTSITRIKKQLSKLGQTPFEAVDIKVNSSDNIFISIKELNDIRRSLVEKLINKRIKNMAVVVEKKPVFNLDMEEEPSGNTCLVYNESQLKICLNLGFKRIYVNDKTLYNKYKKLGNIYYKEKRCLYSYNNLSNNCLISDYIKRKKIIGDYPLNVYNIYTAYYLYKLGYDTLTISVELTEKEITNFIDKFKSKFKRYPRLEIVVYGRVENMLIKGNILNLNSNDYNYNIIDLKKRCFPVYFDGKNTVVLNYRNNQYINIMDKKNICMRYLFYDETDIDIIETVKKHQ